MQAAKRAFFAFEYAVMTPMTIEEKTAVKF